jgi:uncharacterized protein (TIGR00730 family)
MPLKFSSNAMTPLRGKICIFTGSRRGVVSVYARMARELGRLLVAHSYGLVYGGGNVGLMAVIADAVLELGGHVTGVIPEDLVDKEVAHGGLPDLRIVKSMHERKAVMAELSNGFMGLPGGIGTMEEFFEVLSWSQLGIHNKPCGLLNAGGYYRHIIRFLDHAVDQGFLKPKHRSLLIVEGTPGKLLDRFEEFIAAHGGKWFERDQT